jgi:hypothetical protein
VYQGLVTGITTFPDADRLIPRLGFPAETTQGRR